MSGTFNHTVRSYCCITPIRNEWHFGGEHTWLNRTIIPEDSDNIELHKMGLTPTAPN